MELTLDTIANIKIYQNKEGYRFSVDALILYSFVNLRHIGKIADLGAGSGIIGLLLAKKYAESSVTLIELQEGLAGLAERNIVINRLEGRVKVLNSDIKKISRRLAAFSIQQSKGSVPGKCLKPQDGTSGLAINSFDLVVSNPPFRKTMTGLISPTDEKALARHEISLKIDDLIETARHLLKNKGRLCLIFHPSRLIELSESLRKKRMEPKRLRFVHSDTGSEAKMVLVEAVKNGRPGIRTERPLFIYNEDKSYTDEMKALY